MDMINVQLEKQRATDAKRWGSQCHTKVGAGQHSISSETSIDAAFLDVLTGDHNSSWIDEICVTIILYCLS